LMNINYNLSLLLILLEKFKTANAIFHLFIFSIRLHISPSGRYFTALRSLTLLCFL
jgi:hypothetical protein